ncbi:UNVERIFIED_ORG: hypothetical protein ABID33_000277 [Xanthobacter viscosus]|uniref:Transmembrane protein n=1 Tax=Xanthobacter autotrophicus TaxID=280 RepID=A0A6C1KI16_XANAU|nr:hypothetical protein [Xanthobacter autotrophicus]TLX43835.1 hypothetical protein FBQ73_06970 [Xanthobacter autotrophicus]
MGPMTGAFNILRHNADRSIEWFSSIVMLNWAFILSLPGETMAVEGTFSEFNHYGLGEERLAVVLALVGAVRIVVLWINGRWPRGPLLRIGGCVVGAMIWGQIAWLMALGTIVDRGIVATGTGVYAMLAVAEILSIYKAAFDARYERGQ